MLIPPNDVSYSTSPMFSNKKCLSDHKSQLWILTEPLQNYSKKKTFRMLFIWSHCHCWMIELSLSSQIDVLRQRSSFSCNDAVVERCVSFTPDISGSTSNKKLNIISKVLDVTRCVLANVRGGFFFGQQWFAPCHSSTMHFCPLSYLLYKHIHWL